ncbi:hypothetical protein F444_13022, partial [Phytophthora nicotianae P1976]
MNDEEIKNRNDWWLDCEESHTKDLTERAVESGRQKIQAAAAENGRRVDGQENAPSLAECVALSTDRPSTCIQAGYTENLDGRRRQTYTEEVV